MAIHKCGLTGEEFATREDYLAHTSTVTGFKPTDIEHHGERGILIAKKALERTGSLTADEEASLNSKLNAIALAKVDDKLSDVRAGRGPKLGSKE